MEDLQHMPKIGDTDLPAAFQAADQGSIQAKKNYLLATRIDLILILLGAISTSWAIESAQGRTVLAIFGAASLGFGLLVSLYMKITDAERCWFGYRAVAESVKTISWRYMTKAQPFSGALTLKDADRMFVEHLAEILRMPRSQQSVLAGEVASHAQITPGMRLVRDLTFEERKDAYIRLRIRDEQMWYSSNAASNAKNSSRLLLAVIFCQGIAMTTAILLISWADFNFNFSSVFSAGAVALIAWLELKGHKELAFSYAQAAHELGLILAREPYVESDEEFSGFVSDAENAISREHTMWLARRDNV